MPRMKTLFDCVRTRKEATAPLEAGYGCTVAVIMADEALVTGRRMIYDHSKPALYAG